MILATPTWYTMQRENKDEINSRILQNKSSHVLPIDVYIIPSNPPDVKVYKKRRQAYKLNSSIERENKADNMQIITTKWPCCKLSKYN